MCEVYGIDLRQITRARLPTQLIHRKEQRSAHTLFERKLRVEHRHLLDRAILRKKIRFVSVGHRHVAITACIMNANRESGISLFDLHLDRDIFRLRKIRSRIIKKHLNKFPMQILRRFTHARKCRCVPKRLFPRLKRIRHLRGNIQRISVHRYSGKRRADPAQCNSGPEHESKRFCSCLCHLVTSVIIFPGHARFFQQPRRDSSQS